MKAADGQEAVDLVLKQETLKKQFDLILMDCNMPVMDGFQASHQIFKLK